MTANGPPITLVRSPWAPTLTRLISAAEKRLLIACPFVKTATVRRMLGQLEQLGRLNSVRIALITDLRPESVLGGGMDLDALAEIGHRTSAFELTHLPSVHAKVYVADDRMAIVTSGNLTEPGLYGNLEYGVALEDEETVKEVGTDFESYSSLGARVSVNDIETLSEEMEDLKVLYQRAEKSIRNRARRAFEEKLKSTRFRLLRQRAKGKTTHAIFSDTIRFLLAKGPLTTDELHPLVRLLHPDLCDDSLDRIIDGVHFGKKWKHYVRNAQQYLKRHGEICFDGTRWHLVPTS